MTLVGVTYDQLALEDYGVVGNEHLRQDLGGVVSWELGIGEKDSPNTTYIRSHEYGEFETITDWESATDKISFLYYGTRERLSVTQDGADLVISTEPTRSSSSSRTPTWMTSREPAWNSLRSDRRRQPRDPLWSHGRLVDAQGPHLASDPRCACRGADGWFPDPVR